MSTDSQLRGYLLEEALAWLLRNTGYRLLIDESQDEDELVRNGNGLCVKGRGADHQVDVLGEFAFTPAFSLPIRLFLEAKFTRPKVGLPIVRNAHGVVDDINENFVHGTGERLRRRYRYVYSLFSASGFTRDAQEFALAHQISLINLSGASFAWLRNAIEPVAAELYWLQRTHRIRRFPVNWMRGQLRQMLGTAPDLPGDAAPYPETEARRFAGAAIQALSRLSDDLAGRFASELLLGFPSAPFVLPLATTDVGRFLTYASANPDHQVQLRRTGQGTAAEWSVGPADRPWAQDEQDNLFADEPAGYRLTFDLPEELESWISRDEEYRVSRTRAVKRQFLSDIVIYRMQDDRLQTFQLTYEPGVLRRRGDQQ